MPGQQKRFLMSRTVAAVLPWTCPCSAEKVFRLCIVGTKSLDRSLVVSKYTGPLGVVRAFNTSDVGVLPDNILCNSVSFAGLLPTG